MTKQIVEEIFEILKKKLKQNRFNFGQAMVDVDDTKMDILINLGLDEGYFTNALSEANAEYVRNQLKIGKTK